jgi:hypothetical protein
VRINLLTLVILLLSSMLLSGCSNCDKDGFHCGPVIVDPRGYSGSWGTK